MNLRGSSAFTTCQPPYPNLAVIMYDDPTSRPLMRVRDGALIAGVCGGLAKWLGWDPTLVRFGYVVLSILSAAFPGIIVYILLWILMPQEPA